MNHSIIKKIILASFAASCLQSAAWAQSDIIKIGAVATLSGAGTAWGQAVLHGAELAADDVNAEGGLEVKGRRYKVEVVAYDDKYQAGEAVTAVNRLVHEDKVKFIVGPVGSAPALAIQPVTERNKVILMMMAFTDKAIKPAAPFSFRANVTTVEFSQPQIDWLVKRYGVKRIGSLFPNDETGQQVAKDVEKAYAAAGVTLAAKEFYERERVDFMPLLTRIIANGADAIELNINAPGSAGLILRQARELGFTGPVFRTGGPATQDIVNVAGKQASEGLMVHTLIDAKNERTNDYIRKYQAKYKHAMNGFSPSFYDGTHMILEAIKQAGSVDDTTAIAASLAQLRSFPGALGELSWTGGSTYGIAHQIDTPFYVAEVINGEEVIRAHCTITTGCTD